MNLHKTLYPFYTTKKMTHNTVKLTKMRFVSSDTQDPGIYYDSLDQCFSIGAPRNARVTRVAARASAERDQNCLGRNQQTQFHEVVAIQTLGLLHRVPRATQTFAQCSAAAKRLKNTGLHSRPRSRNFFVRGPHKLLLKASGVGHHSHTECKYFGISYILPNQHVFRNIYYFFIIDKMSSRAG